jgi:hypothetical protein|uniref:Uncharacterized protein n=1 Tax=Zea mays TaxID=4577 RepID=B4FN93_MAIZE|nr:unknown [Zea mays]
MEAGHCGQTTTISKGEQRGVESCKRSNLQKSFHARVLQEGSFVIPNFISLLRIPCLHFTKHCYPNLNFSR